MDNIKKQIVINISIVALSTGIIVLAKSYILDHLATVKECLGADIVLVMISSLLSTFGWRFSENIKAHWVYNIFAVLITGVFCIEYGMALVECNDFLTNCICASLVVFIVIYIAENIIIYRHFKTQKRDKTVAQNTDSLGYIPVGANN